MPSARLHAGELTAVIGDNAEDGLHRAGYHGVWSLEHSEASRSLFVPDYSGLNHEHIFNGETEDDPEHFFEPRHAPMTLQQISDIEAELHQPPTPMFDRTAGIRFSHSPSGGGANAALQTTNPAWDFQFIIEDYDVLLPYEFKARAVLRPRCSRRDMLEEFRRWKGEGPR